MLDESRDEDLANRLKLRLRYKIAYHVGYSCAEIDQLVEDTLARFFGLRQRIDNSNAEECGFFLNGVCQSVIVEYNRRNGIDRGARTEPRIVNVRICREFGISDLGGSRNAVINELGERDRLILRALYLEGRSKEYICSHWCMTDREFLLLLVRAKDVARLECLPTRSVTV